MIISTLAEGPQSSFDLATRIWWALSIHQSIGHPPFLHACVVDLTPNLLDTLTCRYYAPSSYLFCTLIPLVQCRRLLQWKLYSSGGNGAVVDLLTLWWHILRTALELSSYYVDNSIVRLACHGVDCIMLPQHSPQSCSRIPFKDTYKFSPSKHNST